MQKIDPHTQKPIIGKDGKPVTEEKEITIPAYKVVSVFDVSQTEGKELPDIAVDELTGDVDRYKDFFAALEKTSPVPIAFENIEGGSHGYYHLEDKRIAINEGMSELQTLTGTVSYWTTGTSAFVRSSFPIRFSASGSGLRCFPPTGYSMRSFTRQGTRRSVPSAARSLRQPLTVSNTAPSAGSVSPADKLPSA